MTEAGTEARAGRLPAELSSLIGREEELAELTLLLGTTRLLTLAGPGGAGKSRLALALAGAAEAAWWVDMAAASDGAAVEQLVAAAIVAPRQMCEPAADAIAAALGSRPALLVLDNCEHVAGACAALAAALLAQCPGLTVLATSRQTLGVGGEQVWRVEGLGAGPAALLFAERARRADPRFDPQRWTRAIDEICRRLDGIPLAIELAAARVAMLAPDQIAERLVADSRLLGAGALTAPERQRTMVATLDWSHELLSPPERVVLRRLSAFRGPFGLGACEAVAAGGEVADGAVVALLAGLVDRSLVQVGQRGGETRYALLEAVRQYAAGKLRLAGEREAVHGRHGRYYLALATAAQPDEVAWLDQLELEHDNLRAALRRLLASDPEAGGRLAGALWPFWHRRGHYAEARVWLEQAAAQAPAMSPAVRAGVLMGAGVLSFLQCDYEPATERLVAALALEEQLGDRRGVAATLQRLGSIAREQARYDDARALHERSLGVWRSLGDEAGVATSHDYLAFAAWLSGDSARAEAEGTTALAALEGSGRDPATASVLVSLGAAALYAGDLALAEERLGRALAVSRRAGYAEGIAWSLNELAILARRRHDGPAAAAMARESLELHDGLGDRWRVASVLEEIGGGLLAAVDGPTAARLLGAAGALREGLGTPRPIAERADHDAAVATLRRALGAPALDAALADGAVLAPRAAVAEARAALDRHYPAGEPGPRAPLDALLTERERAVLDLVSQGATNREIGAALFISPSTAGVHVSNILRKLGVGGRAEAVAAAHRLGLVPATPSPRAPQ